MSTDTTALVRTVKAMRPMVLAKDFEMSKRFYLDLGFQPQTLADRLIEMNLGAYSFILQDYYVREWADNFVMHVRVFDVNLWWSHICALDLPARYGVRSPGAPKQEDWGLVVNVIDPSGVLWRFAESSDPNLD
jgi:hypothetical protein